MKRLILLALSAVAFPALSTFALSIPIGRDINFPPGYSPEKAQAIRHVIQDERYKFVDGVVSYWPPDYGTRLSYEGDAKSLKTFISALRKLPGTTVRLIRFQGSNDELRRDSTWQLYFSQAHPSEIAVYLNLNSKAVDWKEAQLPGETTK